MAALDLGFLQRIVNVQWVGGRFAIGGCVRDATTSGTIPAWVTAPKGFDTVTLADGSVPPPPTDHRPEGADGGGPRGTGMWENNLAAMVGGKFKAKNQNILVAGGNYREMIFLSDERFDIDGHLIGWRYNYQGKVRLFWSEDDGKSWHESQCPVTHPPPAPNTNQSISLQYLAFDPATETFSGDVMVSGAEPGGINFVQFSERTTIESRDGKTWTAGTSQKAIFGQDGDFMSPFLSDLGSIKNNGVTEITNGATDPEDVVTLTWTSAQIQPDFAGGGIRFVGPFKMVPTPGAPAEGGMGIADVPWNAPPETGFTSKLMGFAYSDGAFMIAGSPRGGNGDYTVEAYLSTDNGATWKKVLTDDTYTIADTINNDPPFCAGSPGCAGA